MSITGAQMKVARNLLEWSQDDVGCASGVDTRAIVSFEIGGHALDRQTLLDIQFALESAGIVFTPGDQGAKLKSVK
jgi:transcriptional regulator with XRE-family HTH domain